MRCAPRTVCMASGGLPRTRPSFAALALVPRTGPETHSRIRLHRRLHGAMIRIHARLCSVPLCTGHGTWGLLFCSIVWPCRAGAELHSNAGANAILLVVLQLAADAAPHTSSCSRGSSAEPAPVHAPATTNRRKWQVLLFFRSMAASSIDRLGCASNLQYRSSVFTFPRSA